MQVGGLGVLFLSRQDDRAMDPSMCWKPLIGLCRIDCPRNNAHRGDSTNGDPMTVFIIFTSFMQILKILWWFLMASILYISLLLPHIIMTAHFNWSCKTISLTSSVIVIGTKVLSTKLDFDFVNLQITYV